MTVCRATSPFDEPDFATRQVQIDVFNLSFGADGVAMITVACMSFGHSVTVARTLAMDPKSFDTD